MAHDLVSLITVVDGILHSSDQDSAIPEDHKKTFLESLREKATSLVSLLLDKYAMQQHQSRARETFEALQIEIRDAAHEAEDIIESHAVDLMMLSEADGTSLTKHSMSAVMDKFDAAKDKLMKIITENDQSLEENVNVIVNATLSAATDPTTAMPNSSAMVGFDDDALHLKYRLTNQRRERDIIPIVGMGGIGKTTLARNLYDDSLIVSHFEVRAWATVSLDYNLRAMLLGLLRCIFKKIPDEMLRKDTSELGLTLYQRLCGTRYLVVLDDTWSKTAWDEVRRFLPIENSRSRILITRRNLDVAKHPDSACEEHQMHLLSSAQSWDLLRHKVFDAEKEEPCPPLLEGIGQKIVRDCGGLPLAISVIGGLLSVDKYSKDLWERVAKDVHAVLLQGGNDFSKILSLSYDNLPLHLKPCFLYMAAFPEDFEVRGSKLVKLWAAEGFLWRPSGSSNKNMEDVGEEYLKALVGRNLFHVTSTYPNGASKSYGMHDLLRDLCTKKADDEKFLRVVKDEEANDSRRVGVHIFTEHARRLGERSSLSRSLLCISPTSKRIDFSPILSALRLLRVFDLFDRDFQTFPAEILKLVNLRFLAIRCIGRLPSEIWRLRNLQTVISSYYECEGLTLSHEAWEVPGLKHIMAGLIRIDFKITRDQENLQTICHVGLSDLLDSNLINSVPNVRKLGIGIDKEYGDTTIDLTHMHRLETLNLIYVFSRENLPPFKLPSYLKRLTVHGCTTSARFLNGGVGALQHLEVLKIRCCRFQTEGRNKHDWVVGEDVEFCSLKYLELYDCYVRRWKAESSSFPSLRHLKIIECFSLKAIPTSFGEISTLEMIDVTELRSTTAWAKEILETQREYGNENVRLKMR